MAVDTYGPQGQPLFLDGNSFDLAVDQNAISNYAAGIVSAASTALASSSYIDLGSGWAYDSPTGLNDVIILGSLHIVHLSIFSATPATVGVTAIASMKAGHRPYQPVFTGAAVADGSSLVTGTAAIAANGAIGVQSLYPDVGSDNKYVGLRCTFVFIGG